MKVADHCIRFPAALKLCEILVNLGAEHGGGTPRAQGSSVDVFGLDVELDALCLYEFQTGAKGLRNVSGKNMLEFAVLVIGAEIGSRRAIV